jgi:hypothetical protein
MPYGQAVGQGYNNPEIIYANIVIITGGAGIGIFLYNGAGSLGNEPVMSLTGPNTTEDPYGNPVTTDGFTVYNAAGAAAIFVGLTAGNVPTIQIGVSGSSLVTLNPNVNTPFNITTAIAGVLQSALQFTTTDANEMLPGLLGSVLLNTGSNTKMSTVLTSPLGNGSGAALVLQAENDGSTDTAVITLGTITTPDDVTEIFSPILALTPYALLLYGGTSGQTTVTLDTPGSGNIPIPADAISPAKAECWGSGGGGGVSANFGAASASGGEYACEPALVIPVPGNVPYTVAAPGQGGVVGGSPSTDGNSSTLQGSAVTVTAHGGHKGVSTNTPGVPATGSTNTVHFNSGAGAGTIGGLQGGAGGGSSAGTSQAGNPGQLGRKYGSPGGSAPVGGAAGGEGGNNQSSGRSPSSPGGGASGAGAGANAYSGGNGQVRLTYSTGAPVILASIASVAGVDQFGTNYPAGTVLAGPADSNQYNAGPLILVYQGSPQTINSTSPTLITGMSAPLAVGAYHVKGKVWALNGATSAEQAIRFTATGGLVASSFRLDYLSADYGPLASSIEQFELISALGSNLATDGSMTNGFSFSFTFEGVIVVSTAGTLNLDALCVTSGADTWEVLEPSYLMITPAIAVPG